MGTSPLRVQKKTLDKALGIGGLYSIGYANVGSSIYYALGVTAAAALGATPIAFAIAGLFFTFTAFTYAEGTSMFPEAGGSSSFARHAFNEAVSFIAGWALMLDYIVTVAISAASTAYYLSYFWPILKDPHRPWAAAGAAIIIVGALCAINIVGVKESANVNNFSVAADVVTQALIIVVGLVVMFSWTKITGYAHGLFFDPTLHRAVRQWPDMHHFIYSVSIGMVAFTGIESVAQMAEEAKNPAKMVPQAIALTVVAVLLMYAGINLVGFSAILPTQMGTTWQLDPVQGIVSAMPIPWLRSILQPWVAVLAASILFIATNAGLLGVSRLAYSMGMHRQLPGPFYRLHPKFYTPYMSIIFFSAVAAVLLSSGFFTSKLLDNLADLYSFGAMLSFTIAHACIIVLRVKQPEAPRPYKLAFSIPFRGARIPVTAVLGFFSTLAVWLIVAITHEWGRYVGMAWMAGGLTMYVLHRQRAELPLTTTVTITEVEAIEVPIEMRRVLVPTIGTSFSEEMVAVACRLAKRDKAAVTAVYVFEVPMALPVGSVVPAEIAKGEAILQRAKQIGEGLGVTVETHFLQSRSAGAAIVEEAQRTRADVVFLGVSGGERLRGGGLGATVSHVLRKAPMRVIISRPPLVG